MIKRHGRVLISYSASATDDNYCMGLLHTDEDADMLDPRRMPVFGSTAERGPAES